jgi:hypothetical protein
MQGSWGWDPQEEAHVSGASNKDWQGISFEAIPALLVL